VTPLRLVPFVAVLLGAQALANRDNAIVSGLSRLTVA
jgi:hypothetical protein